MKSTIISMFIVLIVLITVPLFLLGEGDFATKFGFGGGSGNGTGSAETIEALRAKVPKNIQTVVTDKQVEVYKWVDEHGVTQFSNLPPQDGGQSEKLVLSPETNVMDAVKIPEKEPAAAAQPQVFSLSSPYSPGGMKKMVDDSRDLQETLNQRQAEQEQMMQDLLPQK